MINTNATLNVILFSNENIFKKFFFANKVYHTTLLNSDRTLAYINWLYLGVPVLECHVKGQQENPPFSPVLALVLRGVTTCEYAGHIYFSTQVYVYLFIL